jgi:hypothetical protein
MARHAAALRIGLTVLLGACAPSRRDTGSQPPQGLPPATLAPVLASSLSAAAPTPGPAAATTVANAPAPARPPAPPATAVLRSAVALEPSAATTTSVPRKLTPGSEVVVDPAATFEVELSARSADARLVLVDARDDLVPATALRELGAATRLTLVPAAPLVPASRYVLRLDGVADRELHDDAGRAFSAVTLPLLVAGSPPPPEPKKPARKKRRR